MFCFVVDGVRLCHLGDLGHALSWEQVADVGSVDVLFVPVGGVYTVDPAGATGVIEQVKPRVAIAMHFKTAKLNMPVAGVEEFLKGKGRVRHVEGSEAEFKAGQLPEPTEVVVLKPAM